MTNTLKKDEVSGITVLAIDFHDRIRFWDWCRDNGIMTFYEGCEKMSGHDFWSIDDDKHRLLAIMRWL